MDQIRKMLEKVNLQCSKLIDFSNVFTKRFHIENLFFFFFFFFSVFLEYFFVNYPNESLQSTYNSHNKSNNFHLILKSIRYKYINLNI